MKLVKLFGLEHISAPRTPDGPRLAGLEISKTVSYASRGSVGVAIEDATKQMVLVVTSTVATSKTGGGFLRLGSLCDDKQVTELTFGFSFKRGLMLQPANYPFVSLCVSKDTVSGTAVTPDVYITPLRAALANTQPNEGYYELTFTLYPAGSGLDGKFECAFDGAVVFTAPLPAASWDSTSYKDRYIFFGNFNGSQPAFTSSVVGGGALDDVVCYFSNLYAQSDDTLRDGSTRFGPVKLMRLPAKADSVIPWDSLNDSTPVVTDKVASLNQNILNTAFTPHFVSDAAKSAIRIKPDVPALTGNTAIRAISGGHNSYLTTAEAVNMMAQWSYNGVPGDSRTDRPPLNDGGYKLTMFQLPAMRRLPGDLPITKESLANLELVLTPLAV